MARPISYSVIANLPPKGASDKGCVAHDLPESSVTKQTNQSISGEEIGDVVDMVKMEKFKDINFYDSMHRQNVEIAYRMLEWESE